MTERIRMSRSKRWWVGSGAEDWVRQSEPLSTGSRGDDDLAFVIGTINGETDRLAIVTGQDGVIVQRTMTLDEAERFARTMLEEISKERLP